MKRLGPEQDDYKTSKKQKNSPIVDDDVPLILQTFVTDTWVQLAQFLTHTELQTFSHCSKRLHHIVWHTMCNTLSLEGNLNKPHPFIPRNIQRLVFCPQVDWNDEIYEQLITLVTKLDNLTSLDFPGATIGNTRFENFPNKPNLKSFHLFDYGQRFQFKFISTLRSLTDVDVTGYHLCPFSDLYVLSGFSFLQHLNTTNVTTSYGIESLSPTLQSMSLVCNKPLNCLLFTRLTNLNRLFLGETQVFNFQGLSQLTKLTALDAIVPLAKGSESCLSFLKRVPLRFLKTTPPCVHYREHGFNFEGHSMGKTLECLILQGDRDTANYSWRGPTQAMWNLEPLKVITTLILRGCSLSSTEFLSMLHTLTSLDLGVNRLSRLDPIKALTNLTKLDLDQNDLTSIPEGISCLTNLQRLALHENQILSDHSGPDFGRLSMLKKLRVLSLKDQSGWVPLPKNLDAVFGLVELKQCEGQPFMLRAIQLNRELEQMREELQSAQERINQLETENARYRKA